MFHLARRGEGAVRRLSDGAVRAGDPEVHQPELHRERAGR